MSYESPNQDTEAASDDQAERRTRLRGRVLEIGEVAQDISKALSGGVHGFRHFLITDQCSLPLGIELILELVPFAKFDFPWFHDGGL